MTQHDTTRSRKASEAQTTSEARGDGGHRDRKQQRSKIKFQDKMDAVIAQAEAPYLDFTHQVGHLLRKAYQRHTAIFQDLCIDRQLTSTQLAALCAIDVLNSSSLREVGRAAALDPATARGVIDRLKDRGLVTLAPDSTDKRKILVDIAQEGRDLVKRMMPHSAAISEKTMQRLNAAERVALIYILQKMTGD